MPITLEELQNSKQQQLFKVLFLNSPWLMSTWGDNLPAMAEAAVKVQPSHLRAATITVAAKKKGTSNKSWTVAACRVQCKNFTLIFDLPESFLAREDESKEDHQSRLEGVKLALEGKVFAPRGTVDPKAGKAV